MKPLAVDERDDDDEDDDIGIISPTISCTVSPYRPVQVTLNITTMELIEYYILIL